MGKLTEAQRRAYADRVKQQTFAWATGRPYHNRIDNECTPDFSCCIPDMFTADAGKRWQYYRDKHGRAALQESNNDA